MFVSLPVFVSLSVRFKFQLAVAVAAASVITQAAFAAPGDISNLGTLGGSSSRAVDISDTGVVVGTSTLATFYNRGFIYRNGVMEDLGTFGGNTSSANGISDNGFVAGSAAADLVRNVGFRFNSNDPLAEKFNFFPSPRTTTATDANNDGLVVGSAVQAQGYTRAVVYSGGQTTVLGGLTQFGDSYANAISNTGQIVGYGVLDNRARAIKFNGITAVSLPLLGSATSRSIANDVNDAGIITGQAEAPNGNYHAVRWEGDQVVDLGTLGGNVSFGRAINNDGVIVGSAVTAQFQTHAAVWLPGTTAAIDLDAWLDATNPTLGALWTLTEALGINNKGQIVGSGMYNDGPGGLTDGERAFVLDASSLVKAIAIPGDYNRDGFVDSADYTVWADAFGSAGSNLPADGNGDGVIDAADYTVWADHFGQGTPPVPPTAPGGVAVPEPAAIAGLLASAPLLGRRRRA